MVAGGHTVCARVCVFAAGRKVKLDRDKLDYYYYCLYFTGITLCSHSQRARCTRCNGVWPTVVPCAPHHVLDNKIHLLQIPGWAKSSENHTQICAR